MKPLDLIRPQRRALEIPLTAQQASLDLEELQDVAFPPIASLPREHPPWHRDLLALSDRAQFVFTKLAPVVCQVIGFWDQAVHMITCGEQRVLVDASGSYRLE